MASIIEVEQTRQKIDEEVRWLTYNYEAAPENIKAEIQPLIDKRQVLLEQLSAEFLRVDIAIPKEAERYMSKLKG